jgi:hypothetical protein
MKLLFVFITLFSCCIISCDKEDEFKVTFADGVVTNTESSEPVPYAKVYLMKNESDLSVDFPSWEKMDSLITDEHGVFHFDFEASSSILYGFYVLKEYFFSYEKVYHYTRGEMQTGVKPPLSPKSYLEIRVKDEPPFSDYTGIRIPTVPSQELILLEGNPIDTTVYMWLHGGESLLMGWYYRNTDTTWVSESGGWVGCPSFDTCSYEILF